MEASKDYVASCSLRVGAHGRRQLDVRRD
jgi:hypothetical protein